LIAVAAIPKPTAVDLASVERGALTVTVDEDGRARVVDRYVLSAPLSGNLARVELRPGDEVDAGQVVARVLPLAAPLLGDRARAELAARVAAASASQRQARATIARAEVAVESAADAAGRTRQLGPAASAQARQQTELDLRARREELASAQFAARVADHEVAMAQAALGRFSSRGGEPEQLEITAPVAGRVLRVLHENEGPIVPGTEILEIGDSSALEIVVDVLTEDAVHIARGAPTTIHGWGGEGELAAHVRLVEPSAFTRTSALGVEEQRVNVIVDLDAPRSEWESLGDGYRVEASIRVFHAEDVLLVASGALFREGRRWAAFREADGRAVKTEVEVRRTDGLRTIVEGGLSEGARVVVHPGDAVTEGTRIRGR
jgi:HlyD family secretion protein